MNFKESDSPTEEGKKVWKIHTKASFAVLNKKTLSLFENENVNSLIKSISLSNVAKVDTILTD